MPHAMPTDNRARSGTQTPQTPRAPVPEPRAAIPLDEFWRRLDAVPQHCDAA